MVMSQTYSPTIYRQSSLFSTYSDKDEIKIWSSPSLWKQIFLENANKGLLFANFKYLTPVETW